MFFATVIFRIVSNREWTFLDITKRKIKFSINVTTDSAIFVKYFSDK